MPKACPRSGSVLATAFLLLTASACSAQPPSAAPTTRIVAQVAPEQIPPYRPRFGRTRPVIAVIGQNDGTDLTDFVIPYGMLKRADVADVVAVATRPGAIAMRPALRLQAQQSVAEFDALHPDGADYVIVPAIVHRDDPILLDWIRAQASRGATIVSICDGALVVAASGVLDGHRATAHWATRAYRGKAYPAVRWTDNRRFVADGSVVSSAGISAAIPTTLALVEAIAGTARATALARETGAPDWSSAHDSDRFHPRLGRNLGAFATNLYLNPWLHRTAPIGIAVAPGVDEVALALTADAYSRTGRSHAFVRAAQPGPIVTAYGLALLPDPPAASASAPLLQPFGSDKPARAIDGVLADIARRYGRETAFGVALDLEYPDFHG